MAHFVGTPEMESRNCPEIVATGLPELWTAITPDCGVGSRQDLNRSCSPRRDISNAMSHSRIGHREEVDSRLLMVGSQTASLTPGPSLAHNLGCRCPNDQCEAIFDIYVSRTFQWHQELPNSRCFSPCCRTLNIRESRRTPNPNSFQVLGFTLTLGQVRVATQRQPPLITRRRNREKEFVKWIFLGEESEHSSQDQLEVWIILSRFIS
jgi:hypothetical protein